MGISTGGSSPSAAIYLKERFAEAVPENLPEILDFLAGERANIRQAVSCGGRRGSADEGTVLGLYGAGRAADPRGGPKENGKVQGGRSVRMEREARGMGLFGGERAAGLRTSSRCGACGF